MLDNTEQLDKELDLYDVEETSNTDLNTDQDIPEKFRGKQLKDVAKSYMNLEQELGRKANEVGELRKLTDRLLELELANKRVRQEDIQIDEDEFLDDPKKAVNKAISENPEMQEIRKSMAKTKQLEFLATMDSVSPGWKDTVQEDGFKQWVAASPIRGRLALEADNLNFDAAQELVNTYKEIKKSRSKDTEEAEEATKESIKKGSLESGATGAKGKKIFRRADLMRLRLSDPDRYNAMQNEILKAYSEGRVK